MDESKYLQKKLKEYPETLPGLDEALSYPEKTATKKFAVIFLRLLLELMIR